MTRWTPPRWLILPVLMAGCGPESNSLTGSLSVVFPLDISTVNIYRNDEALQITYLRNRATFLDVVARVSVSLTTCDAGVDGDGGVVTVCGHLELKPGTKINLAGEYVPDHPRTVVAHAPGGEPVRLLPRVKRGDMTLSTVTEFDPDGGLGHGATSGTFGVLFESEGGDLGYGRTLNGTFSAVAFDAGFGLP